MPTPRRSWLPPAAALGYLSFVMIGWTGLLTPSLIRSVEGAFHQDDAGIGLYYLVYALAYATGSFGGGFTTERLGRRTVLSAGALLHGIGLISLGLAPDWTLFLAAGIPAALGAGTLDGGMNGLFLDLYPTGRGRAMNLLHLFFSLGALTAPLIVGRLVEGGIAWDALYIGSGVAALLVAAGFAIVAMPDGRRAAGSGAGAGVSWRARTRASLAGPLILLSIAIALYVASEVGVSNWLVRFLDPAPLSVATTGLSLFWAGLTLGRLVSTRLADRFDHVRFTAAASAAMSVALIGAIFAPSVELSIALFALAGFATGPVFPMIIAIGGDRYPDRTSAVSGFLSGAAVTGAIIYPPIMGFLSVTVGLTVAMLGNVLLGFACAGVLLIVGRTHPAAGTTPDGTAVRATAD